MNKNELETTKSSNKNLQNKKEFKRVNKRKPQRKHYEKVINFKSNIYKKTLHHFKKKAKKKAILHHTP